MAARFWVGGTGTWDSTNTANWSATSGGAGGASVPGAADDVTINTASITVTTNYNVSVISVTINASAATLSLGGTLTCSGVITLTQGTFTTNNFNVTATQLSSNNSNTRTINLGSSTVTLTSAGAATWATTTTTGLTFNAGTSQINLTSTTTSTLAAGGLVFYNVAFTGVRTSPQFPGNSITGANTFNNLSFTGPSAAAVVQVTFNSPQTINGTLSTTGTAGNRRLWFSGTPYGIAQTLTINSAPSLTDADFRDIYVIGTAAPISGTRIGDLRGIRGITAATPKTVYWNLAGAQNWSANAWATTSTGTPSTDNFPLGQDIATFTDAGSVTGVVTMDAAIPYTGTVDMSGRTSAMTLTIGTNQTIYGNWLNGSGTTMGGASPILFSGRNTQTITSAGKAFGSSINIDTYGGTVELADALNIGSSNLTVTNGTFDTKNYNVTAGSLSSSNSNVRAINLGSSTLTLSGSLAITTSTNLTFNAGTSQINLPAGAGIQTGAGLTFNNVSYTTGGSGTITQTISNPNIFNNLTVTAPSAGLVQLIFAANQTITGTLTVAGATAVRRIFLQSSVLGTTRTLTVNSLSAQDCDFRDITIAGAAAGTAPTRAGDCGGNTGITFPAPKTVYWNLAGSQVWGATAWATSSGGSPDINNYPLPQDTAVLDDAGSITGTITISSDAYQIGTLNMSGRTSAATLAVNAVSVYGNFTFGSGITTTGTQIITFAGRGTQTITSAGKSFTNDITVNCATGTVQLADALTLGSARTLTLTSGTFDAVTYNVTTGLFATGGGTKTLRMGSGTWTLSGSGSVWDASGGTTNFFKGTANIVLSDTGTAARTFIGNGFSYNKLTIGGTTGTSTLTFNNNNQFTELASTKTVAHTIALGTTTQTFGAWTVTGTAGNVVTVTGTAALTIAGAAVSGVDYLALGTTTVSATSPSEFYAGANSTATSPAAPLYLTAKPADSTRYWVGGTGNWSDTARWSTTSGTGSGASVPRSHDDVVFDSGSNATAYTATVNAVTGGIRCKALTISGPASGNVTLAGSTAIVGVHGNVTLPATGLTRTYSGAITLSGSTTGLTLTTNGIALGSAITVNGVGCAWTLGSALDMGALGFVVTNGSFATSTYSFTTGSITTNNANSTTINFGSSTTTVGNAAGINFGTTENNRANLTVTAGTSQLNLSSASPTLSGNNQTFYNVSFTGLTGAGTAVLNGANTFNDLSFAGQTSAGVANVSVSANQTINGTLTLSAGTNATMRTFVQSDTIGTTRTLTCAAVASLTDIDFRDITISGAAAPVSGTRLGDCKGNSGITFGAAKTVYWAVAGGGNWGATGSGSWSATSGGSAAADQFPLAQDTAFIPFAIPNNSTTITVNAAYNIGTIDMNERNGSALLTLATGSIVPSIYGNWINGTGVTLTGTGQMFFAGRGTQTITTAGSTFTQGISVNSPSGSVLLSDAFLSNRSNVGAITVIAGTFNANGYNVTLSAAGSGVTFTGNAVREINIGSGTWTIGGITVWTFTGTNGTISGTGVLSFNGASNKTFGGGGIQTYPTINQAGAGSLTITGNNGFTNITNTYKGTGAATIALGTTTQTVSSFTASGEAGRVLTVTGTSASSPATLVLTSGTVTTPDYLAITGIRAYNLTDTWYAGANSTNNGSLGWIFAAGVVPPSVTYLGNFFAFF